jgi:polyhydroxyalkanoate synthase
LPLFLELLRDTALRNPELGRAALRGLQRYQQSEALLTARQRPEVARRGGATLRDCGGSGPAVLLVPSLINPPTILDFDEERSLADVLAAQHRVLLLDWGPASTRATLDLGGHSSELLLPLVAEVGPVTLVGYCLGGTLALAAASRSANVQAVATLASPWQFGGYPDDARRTLEQLWLASKAAAEALGFLPMEVLQSAFWQIDPARIVAKFAAFAAMPQGSPEAQRFIALEYWANGGEPLPLPAAEELIEALFVADRSGSGTWRAGGLPNCPMLHVTARTDRIVPTATAATVGDRLDCAAGHVGMVIGRDAPRLLHAPLLSWLEGASRRG